MSGGGEVFACCKSVYVICVSIENRCTVCIIQGKRVVIKRLLGNAFCRSGCVLDSAGRVGKGIYLYCPLINVGRVKKQKEQNIDGLLYMTCAFACPRWILCIDVIRLNRTKRIISE